MNYQETTEYLFNSTPVFEKIGAKAYKPGLQTTFALDDHFGHPHQKYKTIHIAGTNGKGSSSHTLAAILQSQGYKVGLYTSPHLVDFRERIRVNGECVPEQYVIDFVEENRAFFEPLHPSFFELTTVMALKYFAEQEVDYAVIEVGLGGRLDCTNIITPILSIITNISFDHTQFLGNTLAEIAGEKAGIIKPQVPVIYDGHQPEASEVIEKRANELGSPAFALTEDMYEMQKNTREGIDFSFHCKYYNTVQLSIPYIAPYQMMNASLAFFTMEQLRDVHKIPLEKLIEGLKNTHWEGRMETVLPDVIVDGAHNADGVARFVETACHFGKEHPITLLFSAVADKDYEKMIRTVSEKIRPRAVVATEVGGSRVVPATELAEFFKEDGCEQVIAEANVGEAFEKALSLKGDGMLFCVGSLYLVGEIKEYLQKNPEA